MAALTLIVVWIGYHCAGLWGAFAGLMFAGWMINKNEGEL
jgi:hypothetical protein